jgi:hypothetical protein
MARHAWQCGRHSRLAAAMHGRMATRHGNAAILTLLADSRIAPNGHAAKRAASRTIASNYAAMAAALPHIVRNGRLAAWRVAMHGARLAALSSRGRHSRLAALSHHCRPSGYARCLVG